MNKHVSTETEVLNKIFVNKKERKLPGIYRQ